MLGGPGRQGDLEGRFENQLLILNVCVDSTVFLSAWNFSKYIAGAYLPNTKKMEDNLNIRKMEDGLNILKDERRPQFVSKWKMVSIFCKWSMSLILFVIVR